MASEQPSQRSDEHSTAPPAVSLPKGGGAIRDIGEKFAANPATGTGSMRIPIAVSGGRSGFAPKLFLTYESGAGNGAFGFGWTLSLPAITRKTDTGLPRYRDDEESDTYVLYGGEDLVPVMRPDGARESSTTIAPGYVVHPYRPRIEGAFARIERWTHTASGMIHWRTISRDNVTTIYGADANSRIEDPGGTIGGQRPRVFSWLIRENYDDKGNAIVYEYAGENLTNVDTSALNERHRAREANRYIKRIKYGNRVSRLVDASLANASWLFEVVFDYDEGHVEPSEGSAAGASAGRHDYVNASVTGARPWSSRPDPFSSYRAGFEVRTYRRCRRVLMFHHIPDLPTGELGYEGLVRSVEFDYADLDYRREIGVEQELSHHGSSRFASFIQSATQAGYLRQGTGSPPRYLKKSLPPLEFAYSKAAIQETVHELDPASLENLRAGVDGSTFRWVDLHGEGLSGVLTEQAGAWYYKRNLSPLPAGGDDVRPAIARLGPLELVGAKPNVALASAQVQIADLAGDGLPDVVVHDGAVAGLYEHDAAEAWQPFRPFASNLNLDLRDPNLRLVDLDGDGRADVLLTEDEAFVWAPSLGKDGFGAARRVAQPRDEEAGPRVVFADGTQSVYLADMSGDGLTDLVRIRNGDACYWPNLGYGRFGAKVALDNAPWFDAPDQFDQRRIRLADLDGSGTVDILYLHRDGVRLYFNQSGNRLSEARPLSVLPPADDVASVVAMDLLGNGTACLVWSSPLDGTRSSVRYVDVMGGKPHLLVSSRNNLGKETDVHYVPSTRFYLADRLNGRPWRTRLPFPVHVVERVEVRDRISGNRFVTRYAYHHGHFDGVEREFRGFGMVEQYDTEDFLEAGSDENAPTNVHLSSYVPPVLTKSWFHTGVYLERGHISDYFAGLASDDDDDGEYYREPGLTDAQARALLLDDTVLPDGLTVDEEREACRALKSSLLRQEVYALDGTDREPHPYTVTEQNFTVRRLQPRTGDTRAVFLTHAREIVSFQYERQPDDPRLSHSITLEVDDYGNVLKRVDIGYGRRRPDASLPSDERVKQAELLITCVEDRVTNAIDDAHRHRAPMACESRTYQLTGLALPSGRGRFTFEEVANAVATAAPLSYESAPSPGRRERRLIEHVRSYSRRDDLSGPLPLGTLESLALPFETYRLALTPGLVTQAFGVRITDDMLRDEGGYLHSEGDGNWWIPSGRMFYSPTSDDAPARELAHAREHFFLPHRYRTPFHTSSAPAESRITYDRYDLLVQQTADALGNCVTAGERGLDVDAPPVRRSHDYRVLQPWLVMDANRNRSTVAFDALGMVVATSVMGKPSPSPVEGDTVQGIQADLTESEIEAFFADPTGPLAAAFLGSASTRTVYDLSAYRRDPGGRAPAVAALLSRENHASELPQGAPVRMQVTISYSDGLGREIQRRIRAEPGPVASAAGATVDPRWVASGWTVLNNKGLPVREYEPFFSATHRYQANVRVGVNRVLFYDPLLRRVATLHPNHSWEKLIFDPWKQSTWDANDTVLIADPAADPDAGPFFAALPPSEYLPTWHALRTSPAEAARFAERYPDAEVRAVERQAAIKAAVHAATPSVAHADSLGRTMVTVAHNRSRRSDAPASDPAVDEFHRTRVTLDVEGNQREVVDGANRTVVRLQYDMVGTRIRQSSMEAGERWTLNDAAGNLLYVWDSRGHRFRTTFDRLRRPTASLLRAGTGPERKVSSTTYGESRSDAEVNNLRTRVYELRDQSGVVTNETYDFKGGLRRGRRQLARDYKVTLDWGQSVALEPETFVTRARFDALGRVVQVVAPHSDRAGTRIHIVQPVYNAAGLLEQVQVWLNGAAEPAALLEAPSADLHAIVNIDYDAKGQRVAIQNGNGATTRYEYDPLTFRLARLTTRRPAASATDATEAVQDLRYTFDPVGNLMRIRDAAQPDVFFQNARVDASADYTYDAVYRLIEATGREDLGLARNGAAASYDDAPRVGVPHPYDGDAMGRYVERYAYDPAGNLLTLQHRGTDPAHPGWSRTFVYDEPSQLDAGRSNRLTSTTIGTLTETYSAAGAGYDAHGNMRRLPQLSALEWDATNQLRMTQRQAVAGTADPDGLLHAGERTWYTYDATGRRIRKVTELPGDRIKDERIFLGGFEIHRRYGGAQVDRETLHVMDDKRRVALVESRTRGVDAGPQELVRYQYTNHLGSATLELDDRARVISYEEYTPYGSTAHQSCRSRDETPKRYRYGGKERDEESGFYYYGARYYAPWICRWISCDPAGLSDGPNLYAALRNSPVNRHDPTGLQSVGQLIEEKALKAASEERYVSLYMWAFLDVTWSVFGAEGVSKVTAGNATTGDYVSAGIEVVSVIPIAKVAKAGKGLFIAKEVAEEAAPVIVKEVVSEAAPVVAKEVAGETAPVVAKEVAAETTQAVAKETVPAAAKEVTAETTSAVAKEVSQSKNLFQAADDALKKALDSKLPPVAASGLGKAGTASTRKAFRQAVTDILAKNDKHPLRFLLGANGKLRPSTTKGLTGDLLMELPEVIEAGHAVSAKSLTGVAKGTDRFVVMSAHYNRMIISATIEHPGKGGSMLLEYALEIGGIPVHAQTAKDWVAKGLLSPEVLENARKIFF